MASATIVAVLKGIPSPVKCVTWMSTRCCLKRNQTTCNDAPIKTAGSRPHLSSPGMNNQHQSHEGTQILSDHDGLLKALSVAKVHVSSRGYSMFASGLGVFIFDNHPMEKYVAALQAKICLLSDLRSSVARKA